MRLDWKVKLAKTLAREAVAVAEMQKGEEGEILHGSAKKLIAGVILKDALQTFNVEIPEYVQDLVIEAGVFSLFKKEKR